MIDAKEAYRIGIVNKIYELGELIQKAVELAQKIMKKGQFAFKGC